MMLDLPDGTITFLFTDIEGSTTRWERHPEVMRDAVARHDALLKAIMERHQGRVFKTVGDAFYVAFSSPNAAISAAVAVQQALGAEAWQEEIAPLRVRIALHTGEAQLRGNDYFGQALNRVARILSAGHGGQVLLSRTTLGLVRESTPESISFRDLGMHHLKDIQRPIQIFQLLHADLPAEFPQLKTLNRHTYNLPEQFAPCVGRDEETSAIKELLLRQQLRLVTLTGPGGVGKTRLGLQVAGQLTEAFPDGVWFVELATLSDPEAIAAAIFQALGIYKTGQQPLWDQLKVRLDGPTLLFFDGFEQLPQVRSFISDLLNVCPRLKILITSRQALEAPQEYIYPLAPLAVPEQREIPEPAGLLEYGAIALFVQQARNARANFRLTRANAAAVVKICTRLDGLPLAIELAAARLNILSLPAMLKRLESQSSFFSGNEKRHAAQPQTLHGIIEWSYNLLTPAEKTLLNRLTVFKSGCTFEAIESICLAVGDLDVDLLTTLKSLVDKSLLRQQEGEQGEPRFRLMYIIREYALAHLRAGKEVEEMGRQHAAYYLGLAEEIAPTLLGIEQKSSLATLEEEHENLQTALAWYVAAGQIEEGLRLAEALGRFWWMHGHITQGRKWLHELLASGEAESAPAALRARVFALASRMASGQNEYALAELLAHQALATSLKSTDQPGTALAYTVQAEVAFHRGDYVQATIFLEKSLQIRRDLGDRRGTASVLNNLGNVALQQDKLELAASLQEQSLTLFRQVGDAWAISTVLTSLGEVERRRGNYQQAVILYEESLRVCRKLGYTEGMATSLASLGDLTRYQGDPVQATNLYKESLHLFRELRDKVGITVCLQGLAEVAYLQDQLAQSTRLFAQAEVTAYNIGTSILQYEQSTHHDTISLLRTRLEHGLFDGLWMTGQAMTLEQATSEALGEDEPLPD